MSDPAKNNDIEDVLSSIRRLVAENAKAAEDRDALVLTQDHRVAKPLMATADPVVEASSATPQGQQPSALRAEPVLTRRAEGVSPAAPSPVMPKVTSVPKAPMHARVVDPVASTVQAKPSLEVAPPAPQTEQAANDKAADIPVPSFRRVTAKTQPVPTELPETATETPTTVSIPPAPPLDQTQSVSDLEEAMVEMAETSVLEDAITQLESSVSETESDWEPDDVFMSENDPAPVQTPGSGSIDPGMLRDLVVETVRAELRGDLGEKITRNVRKLVRREIQRALTAQSLD